MSPTRWIALTVRVPSEELTEELAEGLVALGGSAVEQDGDRLTTFIAEPEDPDAFLEAAADRLNGIARAGVGSGEEVEAAALDLHWRWQDDQDWSARWKEGLAPRRVGRRIMVTQPWNPVEPDGDDIVIVIDPSSAFGTGEHATTRGALRLLEGAVAGGERVLDVGAGSGILAIAAIRLGAASVLAVEADGGAMATAAENLDRAGVRDRVELVNARVDADYLAGLGDGAVDLITANVLSGVLMPLLPGFRAVVRDDGRVILGGITEDEVEDVTSAAVTAGLTLVTEDREGEWWTGLLRPAG